jgi:hypothetical protein
MHALPRYQFTLGALFKLLTAVAVALGVMHLLGWPSLAEIILWALPVGILVVQMAFVVTLVVKSATAGLLGVPVGAILGSMFSAAVVGIDPLNPESLWLLAFGASLGAWLVGGLLALTDDRSRFLRCAFVAALVWIFLLILLLIALLPAIN